MFLLMYVIFNKEFNMRFAGNAVRPTDIAKLFLSLPAVQLINWTTNKLNSQVIN